MELFKTWPMWRMPVTFGGGMTMEYPSLEEFSSAWKQPLVVHFSYHCFSTACGSYALGSSDIVRDGMPETARFVNPISC